MSFLSVRSKRLRSRSNCFLPISRACCLSATLRKCRILARALLVTAKAEPVAAGLVARRGQDLDDVAVAQLVAQRHDLAVDARAHALVADLGVDRVGEVDRAGVLGQGLDLALGREAVHLLGVEVDLERVQELVRVLDLLLPLEHLAQPGEGLVVLVEAGLALLVLPVGRDALLGHAVHLLGADLDLEGLALVADDRGVQRLVAVGARHGDEVLDPSGHRPPEVVDHPERRVAVGHVRHQHAQGHEVVDLAAESDSLTVTITPNAYYAVSIATDDVSLNLGTVNLSASTPNCNPATITINSTLWNTDLKLQGAITSGGTAWTFDDDTTSSDRDKLAAWGNLHFHCPFQRSNSRRNVLRRNSRRS